MTHLTGKTVLVTGAGGSIGSELCRQILHCEASKVILFDNSELALFNIDRELRAAGFENIVPILGDITRHADLSRAFQENVDVVFHAAAYKHVTLCEKNRVAAYHVNVEGTRWLVDLARIWKVPTLVLVSTDKAVRPTCVMGRTKQLAEKIVRHAGYTVIRLGNVRGSSGSVLPLWKEQIAAGKPVTITDLAATRYFIPPMKAAWCIIDAAVAQPDTYVAGMGSPRTLGDMAEMMGAKCFDIIGLRPGEKKHEELFVGAPACTNMPRLWRDAA